MRVSELARLWVGANLPESEFVSVEPTGRVAGGGADWNPTIIHLRGGMSIRVWLAELLEYDYTSPPNYLPIGRI